MGRYGHLAPLGEMTLVAAGQVALLKHNGWRVCHRNARRFSEHNRWRNSTGIRIMAPTVHR